MSRRNFFLNICDGAAYNTGMAFMAPAAVLPLFVAHYTQSPWALSLITTLYMLGLTLPQPLGSALMARQSELWNFFRFQFLLPRLVLLVMACTPLLPGFWGLALFFGAFGLFCMIMGFQIPMWYVFISQIIPEGIRGRFFGYRVTASGVLSILATLLASKLLSDYPHPWGFFFCFVLAAVWISISYGCVVSTRHSWVDVIPRKLSLGGVWGDPQFRSYVLSRFLMASTHMAIAFYVVVAMQRFHLDAGQGSLLGLFIVSIPSLLGAVWGSCADRWGCKPVALGMSLAAAIAHLVMIMAPSLLFYTLALLVAGNAVTSMNMLDGKWLLDLGQERGDEYISLFNFVLSPAMIGLPLLAGWVATRFGMVSVFAIVACGWFLGSLVLAFGAHERRSYAQGVG